MLTLLPMERASAYAKTFPKWPAPRADERWLDGVWIMGNSYKGSGYYGSFPNTYMKRVMALYPDLEIGQGRALHLFSGSLAPDPTFVRFDRRPELEPDVCGEADKLSCYFEPESFDLIVSDCPYTQEDAEHYGTSLISRPKVIKQCLPLLTHGGHIVWLDQVLPMFSKRELEWWGAICVIGSTNHRVRLVTFFRKPAEDSEPAAASKRSKEWLGLYPELD